MASNQSIRRKAVTKNRKRISAQTAKRTRTHPRLHEQNVRPKDVARRAINRARMNGIELESEDMPLGMKTTATRERADSQIVEQLAEEGQPFEASLLAGLEEAEDSDETEVTTHETLADDVPSEYDPER